MLLFFDDEIIIIMNNIMRRFKLQDVGNASVKPLASLANDAVKPARKS